MKFLTNQDFNPVCDPATLTVVNQSTPANLDLAETYAMEEAAGYLRNRYLPDVAFAATGADRNPMLVMIVADIALYHLVSWLPKRIGFEIRELRYNRAIQWLKDVQGGKTSPDLPTSSTTTDEDGNTTTTNANEPLRHNCWNKNNYMY